LLSSIIYPKLIITKDLKHIYHLKSNYSNLYKESVYYIINSNATGLEIIMESYYEYYSNKYSLTKKEEIKMKTIKEIILKKKVQICIKYNEKIKSFEYLIYFNEKEIYFPKLDRYGVYYINDKTDVLTSIKNKNIKFQHSRLDVFMKPNKLSWVFNPNSETSHFTTELNDNSLNIQKIQLIYDNPTILQNNQFHISFRFMEIYKNIFEILYKLDIPFHIDIHFSVFEKLQKMNDWIMADIKINHLILRKGAFNYPYIKSSDEIVFEFYEFEFEKLSDLKLFKNVKIFHFENIKYFEILNYFDKLEKIIVNCSGSKGYEIDVNRLFIYNFNLNHVTLECFFFIFLIFIYKGIMDF
jgi:hypothetical protein